MARTVQSSVALVESREPSIGRDTPSHDQDLAVKGPTASSSIHNFTMSNTVDWDGPDDPEHPLNWSKRRKWPIITCVLIIVLIT